MAAVRERGKKDATYFLGGVGCFGAKRPGGGWREAEPSIDRVTDIEKMSFEDALMKWGIDKEQASIIDPVVITGPQRKSIDSDHFYAVVTPNAKAIGVTVPGGIQILRGRDGKYRGFYGATYILGFTEEQILLYEKEWNVYDLSITISTHELFYKDVTSITTEESEYGNAVLLRAGGTDFRSGYIHSGSLSNDQIQGIKNLVREKKAQ